MEQMRNTEGNGHHETAARERAAREWETRDDSAEVDDDIYQKGHARPRRLGTDEYIDIYQKGHG